MLSNFHPLTAAMAAAAIAFGAVGAGAATPVAGMATSVTASAGAKGTPGDSGLQLWYQTPAKEWMEAAPIGNGRMGAMVYGGIDLDRIALNEITLWAGQRDTTQNQIGGREVIDEIRKALFEGDHAKADDLTWKHLCSKNQSFGTHLPMGDLVLKFQYPTDAAGKPGAARKTTGLVEDYRRSLDLATAVATTTFRRDGVTYTREYIADYPDDVMAINLTADAPGCISLTVDTQLKRESTFTTDNEDVTSRAVSASPQGTSATSQAASALSHGTGKTATTNLNWEGTVDYPMFGPGGVSFAGNVRVVPAGGKVSSDGHTVTVSGADAVTLWIDMRTNFDNPDYKADTRATTARAAAKGYDAARAGHVADHSALFSRMAIDLGGKDLSALPTDVRLRLIKNGASDPAFDALFFQYGRYMQIASSRPNSPLASNLQGVWNDDLACHMGWTCDYHLDININQNYWSPNRANLAECNVPMFKYVQLLAKYGAETADKVYGAKGWCAHTITNPWGFTAPPQGMNWGLCPVAGAWLASEMWSHYLYTLDDEYLRTTGYPALKGCAEFFQSYMAEEPGTGRLLTGPSISPENTFVSPRGGSYAVSMMPTLDRAIVYQIYDACIQSAKILGVDKKFRRQLEADIKRLPPLENGPDGQLNEWYGPLRRSDPSHRHSSHLMALYPYGQISWRTAPELMAGAAKGLEIQTSDPNWEDTEWSTGNMLCFQAYLKDGDKARGWLQNLFRTFTRENLMTVSPKGVAGAPEDIFSFDATEASVAGMCDMLLQSYDGFIEFLPALPSAWPDGSLKGVCAQGAITADLDWKDAAMQRATLRAGKDRRVRLLIPEGTSPEMTLAGNAYKYKTDAEGIAEIPMKAGQSLDIKF